ncbi:globin [Pseudoalteromonas haloplanktis]|uniref:Globin n=1 Tax=Pseudoalteromonas haloplanktis TaxID=228 RepID=A0ABU1BAP7_PSEHA|nr:globin [Pseudoalteromonas haloplanktis]MDQ9091352.1 globin [Pseudoalteromonas haloplanktis]
MGVSAQHQKVLLQSIAIIKPNFHCFTVTFHVQLKRQALTMQWPSSEEISEKSYLLYCSLERTITHLDSLLAVLPFIQHHANILGKTGLTSQDVDLLGDAFIAALKIHLGREFTAKLESAWHYAIRVFKSIVKSYLFNTHNIVAINKSVQQQMSS